MIEVLGSSGVYAVISVIVVAVASLCGLVVFASKEDKFEDVVAAQKREQEVLIQSFSVTSSKPSKSKKKWAKIKSQKAAKSIDRKEGEPESEILEEHFVEDKIETSSEVSSVVHKPSQKRKAKDKKKAKDVVDNKKENKSEPPIVVEDAIVVETTSQQFEQQPDLELLPEETPKQSKKSKDKKETTSEPITHKKTEALVLDQAPIVSSTDEKTATGLNAISQKKSKAKKPKAQITSE